MSNLLLITDVARLRKIFGRLTEDKNIRLRVVNNLEKGGEEITIEKPDVVFVQTHLSGLSADILFKHLKKQLGRKRSRFVLLASPSQVNDTVLKPYQGWLDTSAEDSQLISELQTLLATLLSKAKKNNEPPAAGADAAVDSTPQPVSNAESSALLDSPQVPAVDPPEQINSELQLPALSQQTVPEASLEEQGITYAPRSRLSVYSEFNSSFDNAVGSTPEPETLEQATPTPTHEWNVEDIDIADTKPARSKRGSFLLWLAPVIIAVVVITYLQQHRSIDKTVPKAAKTGSATAVTPAPAAETTIAPGADPAKPLAGTNIAPPVPPQNQDRTSDKAVLNAIAESRVSKSPALATSSLPKLTQLPDFIPRYGFDKQFGVANPGWERYKGEVTEFKVLREGNAIKAIQIIDRGGDGVPESFMRAVLRQVCDMQLFTVYTSEKKEGYNIQRGSIASNIKSVYYRDEQGGKLRAFVLTWQ